ncbi:MAG: nucleoside kinase [Clostridium sp.]|uniref:nucleoside kinase n=1 Tax=Clostridium sp. TaxID=1506 RepID=UPI0026728B0E|nr:nucleoside kinase [Clostridium sp.]MCI7029961.1 nucleoside kinase [Clostridium sp.]MDD7683459.1 nucleoside kinase [Clostridium sp.]MDY2578926.1 nucleoside kinase [Clostridium sp.]
MDNIRNNSRTLQFIFIKAVLDLYKDAIVTMEHSIGKWVFGEIHKKEPLTEQEVNNIKQEMQKLIDKNYPIKRIKVKREEAIKIFQNYGMTDKVKLLQQTGFKVVTLYELDGRYDYFYGPMWESTGVIKNFDVKFYNGGFILGYPTDENLMVVNKFVEQRKLTNIFRETEKWLNILGIGEVGSLNEKISNGELIDLIMISEALHEKKIAQISDMINEKKEIKAVFVAGPSSSGKTTFANRLAIQLKVNGLNPIPISLDNYFVNREDTPKDENGEYDFESIKSIDVKFFKDQMKELFEGKEVEIPIFNFLTGYREKSGSKVKMPKNGILIIEGIHGLNPILTSSLDENNIFKIYISALTQLNLDNHNRISTADVRRVRRIVRDSLSRGKNAEETLLMWPSIKKGEEKNIFVYQEEADVMFNSTLVYELCVLKKKALEELDKVGADSSVYDEVKRLKAFLGFFDEIDKGLVPENSILREFIGGSIFYKY